GPLDQLLELGLLGAKEADPFGKGPNIPQPRDDQSVFECARRHCVTVARGNDAEVSGQLLDYSGEPLAACRVVHGKPALSNAGPAIALEERHQESPLDSPAATPNGFGHELLRGLEAQQFCQRTRPKGREPTNTD